MKIFKRVVLFLLLLSSFKSIGQLEIGLKSGNGVSKVGLIRSFGKDVFTYSGQLGVYSIIPINKKLFFQNEILFNQIEGRITDIVNFTDGNGQPIGEAKFLFQTHQSYLSLPLKLGMEYKKISLLIGLQLSFELYNQGRERYINSNLTISPTGIDNKRKMNTPRYDVGPVLELKYQILNSFSIGIQGYLSFKDLIREEEEVAIKKQQFLVNVYYQFYKQNQDVKTIVK